MIKLIIKGTPDDAKAALQRHRLWDYVQGDPKVHPPVFTGATMVAAVVPLDKQPVVDAWYSEDCKTPFPAGTLLHYSYPKEP